jgi:hypothetical protein
MCRHKVEIKKDEVSVKIPEVTVEKNEKKPFTIYNENDQKISEKINKKAFTIMNENDEKNGDNIVENKMKNEKKEVNNFEIYSDDKKIEKNKSNDKKPSNVPFVIFDENKKSLPINDENNNQIDIHEDKSHKITEKKNFIYSDDKDEKLYRKINENEKSDVIPATHKTPGAESRIKR